MIKVKIYKTKHFMIQLHLIAGLLFSIYTIQVWLYYHQLKH